MAVSTWPCIKHLELLFSENKNYVYLLCLCFGGSGGGFFCMLSMLEWLVLENDPELEYASSCELVCWENDIVFDFCIWTPLKDWVLLVLEEESRASDICDVWDTLEVTVRLIIVLFDDTFMDEKALSKVAPSGTLS